MRLKISLRLHNQMATVRAHFIEPMLLQLNPRLPEGPQWLCELKLDGYRAADKWLADRDTNFLPIIQQPRIWSLQAF
jgi:ATP-dependent DNA ligase